MLSLDINQLLTRILVVCLTMVAIGLVMVSSSSMAHSDHGYGSMYHHTIQHAVKILVGLLIAVLVYFSGIRILQRFSPSLMMLGLFLSVLVFVPSLSVDVNGAARWLKVGPVVFQPYDLFKLGYILFIAYALEHYQRTEESGELKLSIFVLALASTLLLFQPDFGSFSLLVSVMFLLLFLTKGITKQLMVGSAVMGGAAFWLIISEPYRMKRIATLFDPWSDRYGSGFQLIQAMIAEGNGGISGVGLGQSVQKMLYLPEAHTDFTISVFAEETGIIGVLFVLALVVYLYALLTRLTFVLRQRDMLFECYLVFLIAHFMLIQSLFNIGVNYGLLPTKGITLPFMGYGGTSIVSHIVMIGMVMSISRGLKERLQVRSTVTDFAMPVVRT